MATFAWGKPPTAAPCSLREVMDEEERTAEASKKQRQNSPVKPAGGGWATTPVGQDKYTDTASRPPNKAGGGWATSAVWQDRYTDTAFRPPNKAGSPYVRQAPETLESKVTSRKPSSPKTTSPRSTSPKVTSTMPSSAAASSSETKVLNIRKCNLKPTGYADLENWVRDPKNVYIGRTMTYYVPGAVGSKWRNPFPEKKYGRNECVEKYKNYIISDKRLQDNGKTLFQSLDELRGKNLGCWCHPERCHGHALVELLNEYPST